MAFRWSSLNHMSTCIFISRSKIQRFVTEGWRKVERIAYICSAYLQLLKRRQVNHLLSTSGMEHEISLAWHHPNNPWVTISIHPNNPWVTKLDKRHCLFSLTKKVQRDRYTNVKFMNISTKSRSYQMHLNHWDFRTLSVDNKKPRNIKFLMTNLKWSAHQWFRKSKDENWLHCWVPKIWTIISIESNKPKILTWEKEHHQQDKFECQCNSLGKTLAIYQV